MAENKKSFVLYCDVINTFKELSDKEAGKLIKHILSYVNDENPVTEDKLLKVAFEPIKLQLKRDLKKYEGIKEFRSNIGREGGIKSGETRRKNKEATKQNEANEAKASNNEANEADTATDTVTVINKAAGELDFEKVKELLRTATDRRIISDDQIEFEAQELKIKYNGRKIGSLPLLCNTWANGIKPWQEKKVNI